MAAAAASAATPVPRRRFVFEASHRDGAPAPRSRRAEEGADTPWMTRLAMDHASNLGDFVHTLLRTSFDPSAVAATHSGLIYYLHACWAREARAVLRPDMIWYTVLCEQANLIRNAPAEYAYLFPGPVGERKQDVTVVTHFHDAIDPSALAHAVRACMREPRFADAVLAPAFTSAPPLAQYAVAAAFCDMAQPFYRYLGTFCGLQGLDVVGDRADWEHLLNAIVTLRLCGPAAKPVTRSTAASAGNVRCAWLDTCCRIVRDIITWAFDSVDEAGSTAFFANVFHYGAQQKCMSGHDDMIVSGWARELYHTNAEDVYGFPTHVSAVPFTNVETGLSFCHAVTLAYSDAAADGTWEPQYGIATYEVLNLCTLETSRDVDQLVAALQRHSGNALAVDSIVFILLGLCDDLDDWARTVIGAGGVTALVCALQARSMHAHYVQAAAVITTKALQKLAAEPLGAAEIIRAAPVAARNLVHALREYTTDKIIVNQTCAILTVAATDATTRASLRDLGAIPLLEEVATAAQAGSNKDGARAASVLARALGEM